MLTYEIWNTYYYMEWKNEENLSINEIVDKVFEGFVRLLITPVTLVFDIISIPFYIIAFIIWFMRGCE